MAKGISPAWRLAAASARPVASFLNVDGTLLDFAERPHEVATPAGLVATSAKAERNLAGALALVSGPRQLTISIVCSSLCACVRAGSTARRCASTRMSRRRRCRARSSCRLRVGPLWRARSEFPGAFAESKRFSFAVHYRLAHGLEKPLGEIVMRLIDSQPQTAIEIVNAHYAFELKTPAFDKGKAIATFLSCPLFRGRTPIFVGDDETDEAGFAVVSTRGGFAFSVGRLAPARAWRLRAPERSASTARRFR